MSLVYFVTYVPGSYRRGGVSFAEDLSEFRQIDLEIILLVGKVMASYGSRCGLVMLEQHFSF